ncbi:regulator of fucose operon [Streptococcus pneumoniae]|nr:regulator of fucose operon [Streptococcus pneumoniae]
MTNMFMKLLSAKLFQIDKAHETILLIDSSKFYKTGFFKINPLSKYTTFISDTLPDQKLLDAVELFDGEWVSDIQ